MNTLPSDLPSSVEDTKFRILVVGRSGVGKSSLISKIFNIDVKDIDISHNRAGRSNIQHPHIFPANPRLILHDSNGFEPGSKAQWEEAEDFIRKRSHLPSDDRLHAIWLCIETPRTGTRLLQTGDEQLLKLASEVNIPVVTVFTKYDFLVKEHLKREDEAKPKTKSTGFLSKFKKSACKDTRQTDAKAASRVHLTQIIKDSSTSFEYVTISTDAQMFQYFSRMEMLKTLFETTQRLLNVKESLMPLVMAQQISARTKVNVSIENGFSKYWKNLGASTSFKGRAILVCLWRIHRDIIKVWNFTDPDKILSGDDFFGRMLKLIQPFTPTDFDSETPISKSASDTDWLTKVRKAAKLQVLAFKFFMTDYQPNPQTAQCIAAYIIDLTLILHDLFMTTLQNESQRLISSQVVAASLKRYQQKLEPVHRDISNSTRHNNKGYIADLIFKWLDASLSQPSQANNLLSPDDFSPRLSTIFHNESQYKRLLASKDSDARNLLDLFQWILDSPSIDHDFRRELIIGAQRLCTESGSYPTCYTLSGVKMDQDGPISCGGFADIHRGEFQGRLICLKVIRRYQNTDQKDFMKRCSKEAILWSQLLSPHILPMYGLYFWYNKQICLVSPWMEEGNIREYIKKYDGFEPLLLVKDVTQGLEYLHELGVVHGDLKGENILVDLNGRAYLSDFGLSSVFDETILTWPSQTPGMSQGGTARWQAPESQAGPNTLASDIYSWACVCYEIYTRQRPFHDIAHDTTVHYIVLQGQRPERPSTASARRLTDAMWDLIQSCWVQQPDQRPTIIVVAGQLSRENCDDTRHPSQNTDMMTPTRIRTAMRDKPDFSWVSNTLDSFCQ